ncbi:hypothetical protein L3X38_032053 [Prunus dulcis]|uniref:Uncharacterized protein n=1 Tax=Prunus dulcis TaxID=3755 RepID=A0AAD4VFH5_PRUDU|nr:hypothetical protein L3X38_032053 [Prunus dulcis]
MAGGAGYENAVGHDRVEGLRPDSNAWRMGLGFVGETWGLRDSRAWSNVVRLCLEQPGLLERKVGLCSNEAGCAQKKCGQDFGTKEVLILGKGVAAKSFWFGILELFRLKSIGLEYI